MERGVSFWLTHSAHDVGARIAKVLAVFALWISNDPDRRHYLPGNQAAAAGVASGDAFALPSQEQRVGTGAETSSGGELSERLDAQAQSHASHD